MTQGNILLVPADDVTAESLNAYLTLAGYSVLTAWSQDAALELTRQLLPPAIVVDLDAPNVDAMQLCANIRSTPRTRHIHVTLLAPLARRSDRLSALSSGADEYMLKPVDAEELVLRIRNALRRAEYQNLVDPITSLPGPQLVEDRLRELLKSRDEWALIRISLRGFKPFSAVYGFLAGEEVLRFAARLFTQTVNDLGAHDDFLGDAGGGNFIVITAIDQAEALRRALIDRFARDVTAHYSFREREQGYMLIKSAEGAEMREPLMSLNTQMVTSRQGPFYDIVELTQMKSEE